MSITQDQLKKIANNLCKLELENEKLSHDIEEILAYVELLNEVDTSNVVPIVSVVEKDYELREDKEGIKESTAEELLNCSAQKVIAHQIALSNIMK